MVIHFYQHKGKNGKGGDKRKSEESFFEKKNKKRGLVRKPGRMLTTALTWKVEGPFVLLPKPFHFAKLIIANLELNSFHFYIRATYIIVALLYFSINFWRTVLLWRTVLFNLELQHFQTEQLLINYVVKHCSAAGRHKVNFFN